MNYTFQSFNFRGREKLRPFYDLISNIAAEEFSHIETVSAAINLMLTGIASGQAALPFDSMGNPWTGLNVFSSGNLKLDLLHNFFSECGARANKIRVYEMCESATAPCRFGLSPDTGRLTHCSLGQGA
jgi:manganese catalase